MGKCKDCVIWLLVGMAGTEALEHNAAVGGTLRDVGEKIKELVSPEEWDEIVGELDWLEHPIAEMTADIAVIGSLNELAEKCDLDVSKAQKLRFEGWEANEKGMSGTAQAKYIQLKTELVSLSSKLSCLRNGEH